MKTMEVKIQIEEREMVSNCCSSEIYYSDICSQCNEHCDAALLE